MAAGPEKGDRELLALVREGNHQAFAELVQRHTGRFYRLAYRYVQNRETAEDVVQDAFLKLWENPAIWRPERSSKFTTWFYRIVVNLCLDWQKKKRPMPLDEAIPVADDTETIDEAMTRLQAQKLLEKEIAALPERQRTALNLCFDEELSNQEAAEALGLNLKALLSLVMREKITFRKGLTG